MAIGIQPRQQVTEVSAVVDAQHLRRCGRHLILERAGKERLYEMAAKICFAQHHDPPRAAHRHTRAARSTR